MTTRPYLEQLNRVLRFLNRITNGEVGDSVDYDDDLWSFFQNAWHLKDWIKNDPSVSKDVFKKIEDAIYKCTELNICQRMANRTKHFKLKCPKKDAKVARRNTTVFLGQNRPAETTHIIELNDGSESVAQELAVEIVKRWEEILLQENLPVTDHWKSSHNDSPIRCMGIVSERSRILICPFCVS